MAFQAFFSVLGGSLPEDIARAFGYSKTPLSMPRRAAEPVQAQTAQPSDGALQLLRRHVLPGDVTFGMEVPGLKLYDFHTAEYTLDLPASTKKKFTSDGTFLLGRNMKQNRVKLAGQ